MAFNEELHISFSYEQKDCIYAQMPITEHVLQPFGFLHGGATIALLEAAASYGAELSCDLSCARPFGVEVCVSHVKSACAGTLHAEARLKSERTSAYSGTITQCWDVVARDDEGDVISKGEITTKIASLAYLAEKQKQQTS